MSGGQGQGHARDGGLHRGLVPVGARAQGGVRAGGVGGAQGQYGRGVGAEAEEQTVGDVAQSSGETEVIVIVRYCLGAKIYLL